MKRRSTLEVLLREGLCRRSRSSTNPDSSRQQASRRVADVVAWIDTAFDGHLVFSRELINSLELEALVETEAILADGSKVSLESYFCVIEWFGEKVPVQSN